MRAMFVASACLVWLSLTSCGSNEFTEKLRSEVPQDTEPAETAAARTESIHWAAVAAQDISERPGSDRHGRDGDHGHGRAGTPPQPPLDHGPHKHAGHAPAVDRPARGGGAGEAVRSRPGQDHPPAHEAKSSPGKRAAEPTGAATARSELAALDDTGPDVDGDMTAAEIFERRMLPILRSAKASSCTECHFGGVELRNYICNDQATTFAALRDEGLIDVDRPDESKILRFISRQTDRTDPLLAKVRQNEYQAFRSWIRAAVREPELLAAKPVAAEIGTDLPEEVVRHLRRDRVVQSFVENIWSEMGRCINCHSPERNQRQVREHGPQVSWIVPRDPAATLARLVESGNIDTDTPEQSPVLLKPLGLEDHGGGPKFSPGSRTDKNFRRFLNDYAAVVSGKYQTADQLPPQTSDVTALSGQHLRIVGLPQSLNKRLLKVEIYRWLDSGWSGTPWGMAENAVNGSKDLWQSMVLAVAPRDSARAAQLRPDQETPLPSGRYLVKIYVDRENRTQSDRDYELGPADLYGQVEIDGDWPPGYQRPKTITAPGPN